MNNKKFGFTLIELLLYTALAGVILLAVSAFIFVVWQGQAKSQTIAEVEQQGTQIMDNILRQVKNSSGINSPVLATSGVTMSLATSTINNPIVFDQNSNQIRIKLGSALALPLNNSRVNVSNLMFYNYGRSGTNGSIRVQFTLTHVNPGNKNSYDYSQTFYGTATKR